MVHEEKRGEFLAIDRADMFIEGLTHQKPVPLFPVRIMSCTAQDSRFGLRGTKHEFEDDESELDWQAK